MLLGDTAGSTYGRIYFGDTNSNPVSLTGTGSVVFGGHGANFIENSTNVSGASGTLTIGPNISIRGKNGSIYNYYNNGSLLNQGTISVDVAGGTINVGGNGTNSFTNTGTINVMNGGNLVVPTSLSLSGSAIFNESTGSSISVSGNLTSAATNPVFFRTQGTVGISGGNVSSPRLLEVMGQYVDTNATGFLANNFSMGALNLASNTYVKLIDQSDTVSVVAPEAL
jgi:hypothetical protein